MVVASAKFELVLVPSLKLDHTTIEANLLILK